MINVTLLLLQISYKCRSKNPKEKAKEIASCHQFKVFLRRTKRETRDNRTEINSSDLMRSSTRKLSNTCDKIP